MHILTALKMQEHRHFTILCKTPELGLKLRKGLEAVASMAMNILPGQGLHTEPGNPTGTACKFNLPDWGNLRAWLTQKWSFTPEKWQAAGGRQTFSQHALHFQSTSSS
eukprot:280296-Rhodomonas_salina.1